MDRHRLAARLYPHHGERTAMTGGRHQRTALLLAIAAAGCKGGAAAGDAATPQAVVGAQTAVVTKGPFTETLGAIGTVVPRPGHVAALAAPQPARITHVYVTAGPHAREGEAPAQAGPTPVPPPPPAAGGKPPRAGEGEAQA